MTETAWDTTIPEDYYRCCALGDGHDGCCAWVCDDCNGTAKCPVCNGYAGGDDVTWCEGCEGTGSCPSCDEGMVTDA